MERKLRWEVGSKTSASSRTAVFFYISSFCARFHLNEGVRTAKTTMENPLLGHDALQKPPRDGADELSRTPERVPGRQPREAAPPPLNEDAPSNYPQVISCSPKLFPKLKKSNWKITSYTRIGKHSLKMLALVITD